MTDLVEVDLNHIKRLRSEGRYSEAKELLDAYHDNLRTCRKNDKRIRTSLYKKKLRMQRRKNHLCVICGKKLSDDKYFNCFKCRSKKTLQQQHFNEKRRYK